MKTLSIARMKEVLEYNPETGHFTWVGPRRSGVRTGAVAGTVSTGGYIGIRIDGVRYLAHRLAWAYMTGDEPSMYIDHVNGVTSDNRWTNLRAATPSQNMFNRGKTAKNKSGLKGVWWDAARDLWAVAIRVDKHLKFLGRTNDLELAGIVYAEAAAKYHGEFARLQ